MQSGSYHIEKGNSFFDKKMWNDAIHEYNEALNIEPNNNEARFNLALAYRENNSYTNAVKELKIILQSHSDDIDARLELGAIYNFIGIFNDAINEAKIVLEKNSNSNIAMNLLSSSYIGKGLYDEAISTAKNVLKYEPNDVAAHFNLAAAYHNKELFNEALKEYMEVIKLNPDDEEAQTNLELLKMEMKDKKFRDANSQIVKNNLNVAHHFLSDYNNGLKKEMLDVDLLSETRLDLITKLLMENRGSDDEDIYWWPISDSIGKLPSKKDANKFFFLHTIDYQTDSDKLPDTVQYFIEVVLKDPENLWETVTGYKLDEWMNLTEKYSLHWMSSARKRLWTKGEEIVRLYNGDVRNIWLNQDYETISKRLFDLLGGEAIPLMILGALKDTKQISITKDVKPDLHVNRVLGRILFGRELSPQETIKYTRMMCSESPWIIDRPLYYLGKYTCQRNTLIVLIAT